MIRDVNKLWGSGLNLRVECRACRRAVVLDGRQLFYWRGVFRWPIGLGAIAAKFPCRSCGGRDIEWGITPETDVMDLDGVARGRRDDHLLRARFWHDVARRRDPRRR